MSPMTCVDCSGLFAFLPRGVCVACQEAREESFQELRDWLLDKPDATMVDVTAALGIDEKLVSSWIREGRLRAIAPSPDGAARERVEQQLRARFAQEGGRVHQAKDAPGMMRSKPQ